MFALVNGYPCTSTCDVAVARKNIDPRNPHNDPLKSQQLAEADLLKGKAPAAAARAVPVEQVASIGLAPRRLLDLYA